MAKDQYGYDYDDLKRYNRRRCAEIMEQEPDWLQDLDFAERQRQRRLLRKSDSDPPTQFQRNLLEWYGKKGFLTDGEMEGFRARLSEKRTERGWAEVLMDIRRLKFERVEREKTKRKSRSTGNTDEPSGDRGGNLFDQ